MKKKRKIIKSITSMLYSRKRFLWALFYTVIFLFFVIISKYMLLDLPHLQASHINTALDQSIRIAELEDKFRSTNAQILGGIVVIIGVYFTAKRIAITKEEQITDRFTRAIEHLGKDQLEFKLGGIYALERIAHESQKDYWPIMEILTAYIRNNSSVHKIPSDGSGGTRQLTIDIQAALDVLIRRNRNHETKEFRPFDLSNTFLAKAKLNKADFSFANFEGADLREVNLRDADLKGAKLRVANLARAQLIKANCTNATFIRASLKEANFDSAILVGTNFTKAILTESIFIEANLNKAIFEKANLKGACLSWTDLTEAGLSGAILTDADLSGANLTKAYLRGANLKGACLSGADLTEAILPTDFIDSEHSAFQILKDRRKEQN